MANLRTELAGQMATLRSAVFRLNVSMIVALVGVIAAILAQGT